MADSCSYPLSTFFPFDRSVCARSRHHGRPRRLGSGMGARARPSPNLAHGKRPPADTRRLIVDKVVGNICNGMVNGADLKSCAHTEELDLDVREYHGNDPVEVPPFSLWVSLGTCCADQDHGGSLEWNQRYVSTVIRIHILGSCCDHT
jgi:hypothetical protein